MFPMVAKALSARFAWFAPYETGKGQPVTLLHEAFRDFMINFGGRIALERPTGGVQRSSAQCVAVTQT